MSIQSMTRSSEAIDLTAWRRWPRDKKTKTERPMVQVLFKYNRAMRINWLCHLSNRELSRAWPAHFTQKTKENIPVAGENTRCQISLVCKEVLDPMDTSDDSSTSPKRGLDSQPDTREVKRLKENAANQ